MGDLRAFRPNCLTNTEMAAERHTALECVCGFCVQSFAEGRGSSFREVSRRCFGLCLHRPDSTCSRENNGARLAK